MKKEFDDTALKLQMMKLYEENSELKNEIKE
jgi:hypothetical protein